MRIALIRFQLRNNDKAIVPWHLGYFKDILLRDGHTVDILDNAVEELSIGELVDVVVKRDYEIIGISGIGTIYNQLEMFCVEFKKRVSSVSIIVGGQIVADKEFILDHLPVDYLVCGEGEITLPKLVNALSLGNDCTQIPGIAYRKNSRLVINCPERIVDLDEIPNMNFDNFDLDKYNTNVPQVFLVDEKSKQLFAEGHRFLHIYLSRGCPYKCTFCYRHIEGYRVYSSGRVEEIFKLLSENKYRFISIEDECITGNKRNLEAVCELAKKYNIYWKVSGRVDHVSSEMLKMLVEHNCVHMQFGVESFDDDMLRSMNKKVSSKKNIEVMNLCYQYGLPTVLQLIIGAYGETRETIYNTRKGMWQCHFIADKVACAILNPYPGSDEYYRGIKEGFIKDKLALHRALTDKVIGIVNFSKITMNELVAWQYWIFFEASMKWRLTHGNFFVNKSNVRRFLAFLKKYVVLLKEPISFVAFAFYVFKSIKYWFASENIVLDGKVKTKID